MIVYSCIDCGREKSFYPSELNGKTQRYIIKNGQYRCRSCWNIKRRGKPVYHEKKSFVAVTCTNCKSVRDVHPREVRRLKQPYYCRECFSLATRDQKVIIRCHDCGEEKRFKRSDHRVDRDRPYYCIKCRYKWQRSPSGPDHHAWLGGISFAPYPIGWIEKLKEAIRLRDNHTCQLCGSEQREMKYKLDVHHIDYNKENLDPKNLISLCRSCHPKTNVQREQWIMKFNQDRIEA